MFLLKQSIGQIIFNLIPNKILGVRNKMIHIRVFFQSGFERVKNTQWLKLEIFILFFKVIRKFNILDIFVIFNVSQVIFKLVC